MTTRFLKLTLDLEHEFFSIRPTNSQIAAILRQTANEFELNGHVSALEAGGEEVGRVVVVNGDTSLANRQ